MELAPVATHITKYTKATLVSRDSSTTSASAISNALPHATHVANRFHVINNLMEAASDFLKLHIGKGVKFDVVDKNYI